MTLTMLVLPLPFGPTSPKISPGAMSKLKPLSARRPPNDNSMSRHSSTALVGSVIASHPEHTVVRAVDRRVQRRRDRNAERVARVGRIENAIVPHFGGRVIGALLPAILLQ